MLKFIIFADDTNIFYSSKNLKELQSTVNKELENLVCWIKANKLSLNVTKTNYMLFENKKNRPMLNIRIENDTLEEVKETKFLGVIIDIKIKLEVSY